MAQSPEIQHNQVHADAVETLAEDAIHAVVDGKLGVMVEKTNDLLDKAEAPVHIVQTPPRTLDELIMRAQSRTQEEKDSRRLDVIHSIHVRANSRKGLPAQIMGRARAVREF